MQLPCNAMPHLRARLMVIALSTSLSRNRLRLARAERDYEDLKRHFSCYPGSAEEIDALLLACLDDVQVMMHQTLQQLHLGGDEDLIGWTRDLIEASYPGTTVKGLQGRGRFTEEGEALVVLLITHAVNADLDQQSGL